MPLVYIGVGSNLGDRGHYFEFAKQHLLRGGFAHDLKCSPIYETDPVGGEGQPKYWNAVWAFETDLPPAALLERMQEIEAGVGRRRAVKNEARVLDLDVLFYGNTVLNDPACTVPHPKLHERAFVLVPFCDLAPEFVHPVLKKNMRELLASYRALCGGVMGVERIVLMGGEK